MKGIRILRTLRRYWSDIRSSFWFVPSLLVGLAVALAVLLAGADSWLSPETMQSWERVFGSSPEASRSILSTIASSMITVAGVVFSITLVALSMAASQYTSRILRTFMRSRGTQVVLGVFVGIFAYCLVVMRTIRGTDGATASVPFLAVMAGLALAFLGIAVIIFFIHHIARSIQAAQILALIETETNVAVEKLFPTRTDVEEEEVPPPTAEPPERYWHAVPAAESGYLREVDVERLLAFAQSQQLVVRLETGVGGFVIRDLPVAWVLAGRPLDAEGLRYIRSSCSTGRQRTLEQDAAFGLRQIVDVALKALSPGINDTTTAVMCVDRLSAILVRLGTRQIATRYRSQDGQLRLWLHGPCYADLVSEAFDQIRSNVAGNMTLVVHLLHALERLASVTSIPRRRQVLLTKARAVVEVGQGSLTSPVDRQALDEIAARVISILER